MLFFIKTETSRILDKVSQYKIWLFIVSASKLALVNPITTINPGDSKILRKYKPPPRLDGLKLDLPCFVFACL
jgi:hypothetical protein